MVAFITSFLVTALVTPLVILLAPRLGWVSAPRKDRWHTRQTALMGGIGIFAGCTAGWAVTGIAPSTSALALPAFAIFALGFADDRMNLKPHLKLIGQIAVAALLVLNGVRFQSLPVAVSVPLTFLWIIGITNAVNLLDNMDGLAAGVSLISALGVAIYAGTAGDAVGQQAALLLVGACAGFLIYNFSPARIFMGDCGSMFLGLSLACLSLRSTDGTASNLALSLMVPVALLATPIFDTTLVSIARTLNGRPISQGGRDHSSHRLVALGLSERGTVLALYAMSAAFAAVALYALKFSPLAGMLVGLLLFAGLVIIGVYMGLLKVYDSDSPADSRVRRIGGRLQYKRELLQVALDLLILPVAFVGAHLLRFDGVMPEPISYAVWTALPLVMVVKLVSLAACRAYRGVWRYAGVVDAVRSMAGSTVGSLATAAALGLLTQFQGISRSALITDWLVFTLLAMISRMSFVSLREIFGQINVRGLPKTIILGAGPEAAALIQKLRDPFAPARFGVVGILDDDPGKHGRTVHGVPILGTIHDVDAIVADQEVEFCLLGVQPESDTGKRISELCAQNNLPLYRDPELPPLVPSGKGSLGYAGLSRAGL